MANRSERLYQLGFEGLVQHQDVTPAGFTELVFPARDGPPQLGRFVREATASAVIASPQEAAQYLIDHIYSPFEDFDQEELWVLLLNTKGRITHEVMVYRGNVNTAIVRIPELFKEAVRVNAPSLILSHCHPSGNPSPSPEDLALTKRANEAAAMLDLDILDHIIIGQGEWVSLKESRREIWE